MNVNKLFFLAPAIIFCACASSTKSFRVETIPSGAAIEVDNQLRCRSTPCEIELRAEKHLIGACFGTNRVTALPKNEGLFQQSKMVSACDLDGDSGTIFFDLRAEPRTATIPIEVKKK